MYGGAPAAVRACQQVAMHPYLSMHNHYVVMEHTECVHWCCKLSLPVSEPSDRSEPADRPVLARDLTRNSKCYTVFDTPAEAADFAERHSNAHMYEVIERAMAPVHMFFELACPQSALQQFLTALQAFLSHEYDVQACHARGVLRVRMDVQVRNMLEHRFLVKHLIAYVISRAQDFPDLMTADNQTVIGVELYTSFTSVRMLGMSEWGSDSALQACAASSDRTVDHMVGVYPGAASRTVLSTSYQEKGLPPVLRWTGSDEMITCGQCSVATARFLNTQHQVQEAFQGAEVYVQCGEIDVEGGVIDARGQVRLLLARNTRCPYANCVHPRDQVWIQQSPMTTHAEVECTAGICQQESHRVTFTDVSLAARMADICSTCAACQAQARRTAL